MNELEENEIIISEQQDEFRAKYFVDILRRFNSKQMNTCDTQTNKQKSANNSKNEGNNFNK